MRTDSLVEQDFRPVYLKASLGELVLAVQESQRSLFPVLDEKGRFQGYVSLADIRQDMFKPELYRERFVYHYLRREPEFVSPGEPMDSVMRKFEKTGAWNLPVLEADHTYLGYLSKSKIFNAYREELKGFSQD